MTRCKVCRNEFTKRSITHKTCGADCAEVYGREQAFLNAEKQKRKEAKEERLNQRIKRENIKSVEEWKTDAQTIFNRFIRMRDAGLPCISCNRHSKNPYHAGHFVSKAASSYLRYNELNVHKQCDQCNTHLAGNILNYREGLVAKIGLLEVEALRNAPRVKRWTVEELKTIKTTYAAKLRELKIGME